MSGQFSRIKNEAVNLRKNIMLMTQDADNWDVTHINPNDIDPLRSILSGELRDIDDNDNIFIDFDKFPYVPIHNTVDYDISLEDTKIELFIRLTYF